jgi:glycine betaine/proline transport system substrate-binding protein
MSKVLSTKRVSAALLLSAAASLTFAQATPGKGVAVQPLMSSIQEETFQTRIIMSALKDLGYDVKPIKEVEYATAHVAIGNGDGTFMADHWMPLHEDFYKNAGGDAKLFRKGQYIPNNLQGYLIDKKTADANKIINLGQLTDPKIAKLFDADGDGKADLAGCVPGWGCEKVIEHQLTEFKLRDTVTHRQGAYAALIADVIARNKAGKPVLYYTWTPYWVSGVLVPGKDVVWLEVPRSSLPGSSAGKSTKLPNGKDYGFEVNSQHVVASKAFTDANPSAAKVFELAKLDVNDVNAQNTRMNDGEKDSAAIDRHVAGWIKANQKTYDGWLAEARAAKK